MSIFTNIHGILKDIASLFLPPRCIACGASLRHNEQYFCLQCRTSVPRSHLAENRNNKLRSLFENNIPIEAASALLWYSADGKWRNIIHRFKYNGEWRLAEFMGEWIGSDLAKSGNFEDIDIIVPVPLHPLKHFMRGYNQSEHLCIGISKALKCRCRFNAVKRRRYNKSQARKMRKERWDNVEGIFSVKHAEQLRGQHILIVDDVITTGATIIACAKSIIEACEGDVRISIAALAASQYFNPTLHNH